jgi:hypothetical protein
MSVEKALPKAEVEARSPVAMCRRDACDKPFLAVVKIVDQMLVKVGIRNLSGMMNDSHISGNLNPKFPN